MDSFQTNPLEANFSICGKGHILRVGLTGGIGSGKSAVANVLGDLGAVIIDTDVISHEITNRSGLAISAIRQEFGEGMISADGSLDRPKMRALIFDDPSQKARAALQHNSPYIVFVVPLLIESGQWLGQVPKKIDYVVVVDCSEDQQLLRVQSRSNLDQLSIQKIMATQVKREDRLAVADYVIENNGSLIELEKKAAQLHELLLHHKNP
jgi:dephospho-CoA kinase